MLSCCLGLLGLGPAGRGAGAEAAASSQEIASTVACVRSAVTSPIFADATGREEDQPFPTFMLSETPIGQQSTGSTIEHMALLFFDAGNASKTIQSLEGARGGVSPAHIYARGGTERSAFHVCKRMMGTAELAAAARLIDRCSGDCPLLWRFTLLNLQPRHG